MENLELYLNETYNQIVDKFKPEHLNIQKNKDSFLVYLKKVVIKGYIDKIMNCVFVSVYFSNSKEGYNNDLHANFGYNPEQKSLSFNCFIDEIFDSINKEI